MTALIKYAERFTEATIDDEIVIMRIDNGEFFALSGSAAAIWRLIDGTRNPSDLLADISSAFAGDTEEISKDIDEFLEQLRAAGLIGEH